MRDRMEERKIDKMRIKFVWKKKKNYQFIKNNSEWDFIITHLELWTCEGEVTQEVKIAQWCGVETWVRVSAAFQGKRG